MKIFLRKIVTLSLLGMLLLPAVSLAGHHPGSTDGVVPLPPINGVADTASAGSSSIFLVITVVVVLVIIIGLLVKKSK